MKVQEVLIVPKACYFTRFISRVDFPGNDPGICWLLRATLRDGSEFAIDVCNAQYAINTAEDSNCGVFPWEPYMERLSVSNRGSVEGCDLGFCWKGGGGDPTGSVEDIKNGSLTAEDKQFAGTLMVSCAIERISITPGKLPYYDEGRTNFKAAYQQCLDIVRGNLVDGGAQQLLLQVLQFQL